LATFYNYDSETNLAPLAIQAKGTFDGRE
jgi:hypothetical protein